MARQSPVHYINPSTISITPNANSSENDLAVNLTQEAKIRVFSQGIGSLGWNSDNTYQEWTLNGRNRRLGDSEVPYTIYARLPKGDKTQGYLVFAPMQNVNGEWKDKYAYVTEEGLSQGAVEVSEDYWYIRLGEVSLPDNNRRTIIFDTGILGTDQYNSEWNLDPDDMPLRVLLSCTIEGEDAGNTPYVTWAKSLILRASLVEGWEKDATSRIHHWSIARNTGNPDSDAEWPSEGRAAAFAASGNIALSHVRGVNDDFAGAVSAIFTVTAWGRKDSDSSSSSSSSSSSNDTDNIEALASASIAIMAETVEKMELELSRNIVNYNPQSDVYYPIEGIKVRIRALDQKGNVFKLTKGQYDNANIIVQYALADSNQWTILPYTGAESAVAEATIPMEIFHVQQNVNVRIVRQMEGDGGETVYSELTRQSIAFLRDGEDSKEREWIYIRSNKAVIFGTPEYPMPADIAGGEVNPEGAAAGLDTDKQQDGWVPEGWFDEMQGTDDEFHYEYAAYRDYLRASDTESSSSGEEQNSHWGEFSTPRLWSYKGEDAVSYRCRWTLAGTEIWQLTAAYTGAFRGTLPLVATLMKRKGNEPEEVVTATSTIIHVSCEGLPYQKTVNTDNPQFTISELSNKEFIDYLNNVALTGLSITFAIEGEEYHFSIPMIREADEDSVKRTINEYGSEQFLSKLYDDVVAGKITFQDIASFLNGLKIGGVNSAFGISSEAIATLLGIKSDNYTGDGQFDAGFQLMKDPLSGISSLVVDNIMVRMKAIFNELEIRKISYSGGNIIFSHAGSKIVRVEAVYGGNTGMWFDGTRLIISDSIFGEDSITAPTAVYDGTELKNTFEGQTLSGYRCYLLKDDGSTQTENWWRVGDQARCETFNIKKGVYQDVTNSFYWRLVVATGQTVLEDGRLYDYIDLSAIDRWVPSVDNAGKIEGVDYSDATQYTSIPQAGDQIVQMGNRGTDAEGLKRQGFITIEVSGEYAPAFKMYKGVNSYSLENKRKICFSPVDSNMKIQKLTIETEYDAQRVPMERGEWDDIADHRCYYYDLLQHNGSTWLCTYPESGIGGVLYTTVEPGDSTAEQLAFWRKYAAKGDPGVDADVWTIGQDGYWYKNGVKTSTKAEGKDGTGVELNGGVDSYYTATGKTSLQDLTGIDVGDCYIVNDANDNIHDGHLYFYQGGTWPNNWRDLGRIKGTDGVSSYMHVAYADSVTLDSSGTPIACTGFTVNKVKDAYAWVGLCTNDSVTDPTTYTAYEWNKVRERAMTSVSEHYNVSNSPSTQWNVPASGFWTGEWTGNPAVPDGSGVTQWNENNRYLWNYELIVYTEADGTTQTYERTTPKVVAIWTKDGKSINSITNYYAINNNPATPPASGWSTVAIAPTTANPYLWNYEVISYNDGSTPTTTQKHVVGVYGSKGDTIREVTIYRCGSEQPKTPIGNIIPPSGWSLEPAGIISGTLEGNDEDGAFVRKTIHFRTESANQTIAVSLIPSSEEGYDFIGVGNVDEAVTERPSYLNTHEKYYTQATSGDEENTIECTFVVATAGEHTIDVFYTKDGSEYENFDNGTYIITGAIIVNERIWASVATFTNNQIQGTWSTPVEWAGDDAVNIMLSPESVILNQNLSTKLIDLTQAYADISVVKGETLQTGFVVALGTGTEAPVHCNASVINGNRVKITAILTNNGQYYDNGSVTVKITYRGKVYTKVFKFYANLLGSWKENVENDTKTAVAAMKYWTYDENGQQVVQKTVGEYIQSSSINQSTIESTVDGLKGNGGNILVGSEMFTVDGKLEHVSTQKDGVIEYPQGSSPAIYSAVRLVAGKTYILQIKSDGNLASQHDGNSGADPTSRYYTVWLRINGTLDGEPYNGHCFTSANRTGILDDGALWWRFKCELTGMYWFRTNTYSDGTTPVTVHFWDLMLEQSTIPSGWSAPSSRVLSQIKQTASEINLNITTRLGETGINIDGNNREINLKAGSVNFVDPNGDPYAIPKIIIDPNTGTLRTVDAILSGMLYLPYTKITRDNYSDYAMFYHDTPGDTSWSIDFSLAGLNVQIDYYWSDDIAIAVGTLFLPYPILEEYLGAEMHIFNARSGNIMVHMEYFYYQSNNMYYDQSISVEGFTEYVFKLVDISHLLNTGDGFYFYPKKDFTYKGTTYRKDVMYPCRYCWMVVRSNKVDLGNQLLLTQPLTPKTSS